MSPDPHGSLPDTLASPTASHETVLGNSKRRRPHKKSKNGCKECRRRHLKCDETRPSCRQCSMADHPCVYFSPTAPKIPSSLRGNKATGQDEPENLVDEGTSSDAPSLPAPSDLNRGPATHVDEGGLFNLSHMRLLHHVETNMLHLDAGDRLVEPMLEVRLEAALNAHYLMDILLALAALHLAVLNPSHAEHYHHQAMQLQTRGLALFNKAKEGSAMTSSVPIFFFSYTLGVQALYDVLRNREGGIPAFVDRFTKYLRLHRGVSLIAAPLWQSLKETRLKDFVEFIESAPRDSGNGECDSLHDMLERSDLGPGSRQACFEAVGGLQRAFGLHHYVARVSSRRSSGAISFAVHISPLFIDILQRQQPESLVILAHYAVLLHWSRSYWLFSDGGKFIIEAVTEHLGPSWAQWLSFPNSVLANDLDD